MKKGLWLVVLAICAVSTVASAGHRECARAWAGCTNANPVTFEPQELALKAYELELSEIEDYIYDDDGNWYEWNDNGTPEKAYNFMMFRFSADGVGDMTSIICNWQIRVDGGAPIYLFYWDNSAEDWVHCDTNGGGATPATKQVDVHSYFYDYLTLLAVGNTDGAGEDAIECDVCDLTTTP